MKIAFTLFHSRQAILLLMLTASFVMSGLGVAKETDLTLRPDPKGTKTVVKLAIKVLDIDEIDGASQTFTANVAVIAGWKDARLAGGTDKRMMPLSDVWNPALQFSNQQRLLKTFPDAVTVSENGDVKWIQRYWGKFSQPLQLHDFPLDQHTFTIQMVVGSGEFEDIKIEEPKDAVSKSGLAKRLSLPDWDVTNWEARVAHVELIEGGNQLPGMAFDFHAKRYIGYYLVKVLLPLLMIVMMSWIVFWIHPSEAGSQISVSITSMLTLIAYRFALGAMLPKVSYITRMDGFILFATVMVFIALMEAVTTSRLVKVGKEELALKMDLVCRVLFPATFIAVCIFAIWS